MVLFLKTSFFHVLVWSCIYMTHKNLRNIPVRLSLDMHSDMSSWENPNATVLRHVHGHDPVMPLSLRNA